MTNPNDLELYKQVLAHSFVKSLGDEALRRSMAGPVLEELGKEFTESERTYNPVIEPNLLAKIYGLSLVQQSQMGVYGFTPSDVYDYKGEVTAKIAPAHSVLERGGNEYRARVICFTNDYLENQDVTVFGVNIYAPDMDEAFATEDGRPKSKLLLVDGTGKSMKKEQPVAGGTPIIAVYSNKTGDAKIYHVETMVNEGTMAPLDGSKVVYTNNYTAEAFTPDGQKVEITQLTGLVFSEAINELEEGLKKLKTADRVELSSEEQAAAREVGGLGSGFLLSGPEIA